MHLRINAQYTGTQHALSLSDKKLCYCRGTTRRASQ